MGRTGTPKPSGLRLIREQYPDFPIDGSLQDLQRVIANAAHPTATATATDRQAGASQEALRPATEPASKASIAAPFEAPSDALADELRNLPTDALAAQDLPADWMDRPLDELFDMATNPLDVPLPDELSSGLLDLMSDDLQDFLQGHASSHRSPPGAGREPVDVPAKRMRREDGGPAPGLA